MQKIAAVTVGAGGATSIDLTSIPGTFTDLMIVFSLREDTAIVANSPRVRINGDTGANYISVRYLLGSGSAVSSSGGTSGQTFFFLNYGSNGASSTSSTFSNGIMYFPNYAGSTVKNFSADSVAENNATTGYQTLGSGQWSGSAAINSISIYNANYLQNSTVYVYGITKGSGGATAS